MKSFPEEGVAARGVTARVPGTCGELVQGVLEGEPFLITWPVNRYSHVKVTERDTGRTRCPPRRWKMAKALRLYLAGKAPRSPALTVSLSSQIDVGKGMASSTADVVAVLTAASALLGEPLAGAELAGLALEVEPSDGVMFPGIVLFDYLAGRRVEHLGPAPRLKVLAVDLGGVVDTLDFNRRDIRQARLACQGEIAHAVDMVRRGLREHDLALLGEAAVISARCNQRILPKENLERLIALGRETGALGLNVAHSGSMVGLLYREEYDDFPLAMRTIARRLGSAYPMSVLETVDGGGELIERFPRGKHTGAV